MNDKLYFRYVKRMLLYVLPLGIVIAISFLAVSTLFVQEKYDKHTVWLTEENLLLSEILESQISDLFFLTHHVAEKWDGQALPPQSLEKLFLSFAESKDAYYQVRLLDRNANELIKIRTRDGLTQPFPKNGLENKQSRYYMSYPFQSEAEVYLSRVDLNVENNVIERPLQPVLRIVKPVYREKQIIGYVVLNYNMQRILKRWKTVNQASPDKIYLQTSTGSWILGPDNTTPWGDMLGSAHNDQITETHPKWIAAITADEDQHVQVNDSLLTVMPVLPALSNQIRDIRIISEEQWQLIAYSPYSDAIGDLARFSIIGGLAFSPLLILIAYSRVTSERIREKDLLELHKLSSAVENAKDIVFITDKNGKITYVNQAFVDTTGYRRREALGNTPAILSSGTANRLPFDQIMEDIYARGSHQAIVKNLRKDGSLFHYDQTIAPVYSNAGEIESYVSTGKDITERVLAQEALRKHMQNMESIIEERTKKLAQAKQEAEAANKAKSVFLAHMSHEIRTPLNAVIGFSQILSRDATLCEDQHEQVTAIERSGEHLLTLINDILEISKIESGRIDLKEEAVDPKSLLTDIERMFELRVQEKGISFEIETRSEFDKAIVCDHQKLRQILINLIGNAVKFTVKGGVVATLDVEEEADGSTGKLRCSVLDTAGGIPEDQLESIFQPFEQAQNHAATTGTGLGLAITKRFIERMGGTLEVTTRLNEGSRFSFSIPVTLEELSAVSLPIVRQATTLRATEEVHILIVDDKQSNRKLLQHTLSFPNLKLHIAENGKEALDILEDQLMDFIFMDLRMPVLNGIDATAEIRRLYGDDLPICAITASVFLDEVDSLYQKGFDTIIRKPFHRDEIFSVLADAVDAVHAEEEMPIEPGNMIHLDSSVLTEIPSELAAALREAVELGDLDAVVQILQDGDPPDTFTNHVTTLCHHFDLTGLLALLERIDEQA